MNRHFLRTSQRIISGDDFRRVLSYKCFACKGIVRLYAAPNTTGKPRIGVSIGKACGTAVQRNRLKRLGREFFRLHQHEIPAGYDYILIFTQKVPKTNRTDNLAVMNNEVRDLQYKDIESRLLAMIEKLRQQGRLKES